MITAKEAETAVGKTGLEDKEPALKIPEVRTRHLEPLTKHENELVCRLTISHSKRMVTKGGTKAELDRGDFSWLCGTR